MDVIQLDQYIMNLCTFGSETCYSVFIHILFLITFSSKQSQFTLSERAYLHLEMEWKVCVILQTIQETLHMFSSQCKPDAFYTESHPENGCSQTHTQKKFARKTFWDFPKSIHKITFSIPITLIKPIALVPDPKQTNGQNLLLCVNLILTEDYVFW